MKTCPNCGFQCEPTDTECVKCGILFEKWQAIEARKKALERQKFEEEAKRITEQDAEIFAGLEERDAKRAKRGIQLRKVTAAFDIQNIWHYFTSKPRLYAPSIGIVLTLSVLYLWGPVGLISSEKGAQRLEKSLYEWESLERIAGVTPRIGLVNIVPKLQEIKERTKLTEVPLCLDPAKSFLIQGMERSINSYISFMADDEKIFVTSNSILSKADFLFFKMVVSWVRESFFKRIWVLFKSDFPIIAEKNIS